MFDYFKTLDLVETINIEKLGQKGSFFFLICFELIYPTLTLIVIELVCVCIYIYIYIFIYLFIYFSILYFYVFVL